MLQNLYKILQQQTIRKYTVPAAKIKTPANTTTKPKPQKQKQKQQQQSQQGPPLISCRRTQYNLWTPEREDTKFGVLPLASNGWLSNKSKGDHFTLHATVSEQQLQAELHNVDEFLQCNSLHLHSKLLENLKTELDIKQFTNIQVKGIPVIYQNKHALIAAETGCGKTLTYMLPIFQRILEYKAKEQERNVERKMNAPLLLILTPGRELATQIANVAEQLVEGMNINIKVVLGGNTKKLMMNPEFENVDVVVATIGALSKLVTTGIYRMGHVRHVVLDEADTLLDDSFTDKLTHFLKRFPFHRIAEQTLHDHSTQLVLASATMPTNTDEILQRIIDVETLEQVVSPHLHKLMPHIEQKFQRLSKADRPAQLLTLVKRDVEKKRPLIIFSNKSATSDFVDIFLNNSGVKSVNLNGDMLMQIRRGRFEKFQQGDYDVLSTTDIGSRGLDTTRARHVINYDFPLHISDYIHRCGRIGRVGNLQKSLVTNFISSRREVEVVQKIEHAARTGGVLPNVNANIKNIINKRIMKDMEGAGMPLPEEEF